MGSRCTKCCLGWFVLVFPCNLPASAAKTWGQPAYVLAYEYIILYSRSDLYLPWRGWKMLGVGSPALPVAPLQKKGYSVGFFREPPGLHAYRESLVPP